MPNLIIFEGCDGSGKTTAVNKLANKLGAKVKHFDQHSVFEDYMREVWKAQESSTATIFDRCWISERPYGIVYRNGLDRLDSTQRKTLESEALKANVVLVRCVPGWDEILRSFRARKGTEMLDNEQQLKRVFELYRLEPSAMPTIWYDWTMDKELTPEYLEGFTLNKQDFQQEFPL